MATLFDRLEPAEERVKQPSQTPAQLLLTWLQKWNRPTIRMNQILVYGPSCTRKREDAISATKILTEHRWLTPSKHADPTCSSGRSAGNPSFTRL
jgi:hypothetical protein